MSKSIQPSVHEDKASVRQEVIKYRIGPVSEVLFIFWMDQRV